MKPLKYNALDDPFLSHVLDNSSNIASVAMSSTPLAVVVPSASFGGISTNSAPGGVSTGVLPISSSSSYGELF